MSAEIQNIDDQREEIVATTTFNNYHNLVTRHFEKDILSNNEWLGDLHSYGELNPDLENNPDFYRFLGFVAIVCARNGFPILIGQKFRHDRKGWTDPLFTPEHQLANAIYVADLTINVVDPLKDRLSQQLQDRRLEPGIQGMFIRTKEGRVMGESVYVSQAPQLALKRLNKPHIICEPNRELDRELSTIPFTGNDADSHTPQAVELFRRTVLPKVEHVTSGLVNARAIFVRS